MCGWNISCPGIDCPSKIVALACLFDISLERQSTGMTFTQENGDFRYISRLMQTLRTFRYRALVLAADSDKLGL